MNQCRKLARILLNLLIPLITIGLTIWLLPKVLQFFIPFVIGGIIAFIANPLVRFLERKVKIRRKFGTVLTIGGTLALVIGGGYLLLARLARECFSFLTDLPKLLNSVGDQLQLAFSRIDEWSTKLPFEQATADLHTLLDNIGDALVEAVKGIASKIGAPTVEAAGNIAKSIPTIFVMLIITILAAYFFLAEKEQVAAFYHKFAPKKMQEYLELMRRNAKRLVGGYFMAQFKIMGVVALLLIAGFLILGIPYAAIWGILIAILDFLPVFGTGTALIPWALIQLIGGRVYMAIGLAACWLITQAAHQMIQPKMVGDSMGLDPLKTLFYLYLGFRFSGISGMILAVPIGLLAEEFYKYGAFDPLLNAVRELIELVNQFRHEGEETAQTKEAIQMEEAAQEPTQEPEDKTKE